MHPLLELQVRAITQLSEAVIVLAAQVVSLPMVAIRLGVVMAMLDRVAEGLGLRHLARRLFLGRLAAQVHVIIQLLVVAIARAGQAVSQQVAVIRTGVVMDRLVLVMGLLVPLLLVRRLYLVRLALRVYVVLLVF